MEVPFIGGAYSGRFRAIDSEECVNWYVEQETSDAKTPLTLIPTPGLNTFVTTVPGSGVIRGMYCTSVGRLFVVRGTLLSEILSSGQIINRGTLNTTSGFVSMADNGSDSAIGRGLYLVDGVQHYILNLATNIFLNVTNNPPNSTVVVFIDSFFIVNELSSGRLYSSYSYCQEQGVPANVDASNLWDLTAYATKEGSPDPLVTISTAHDQLWLFGASTTEIWYNAGLEGLAFERVQGALIQNGCIAPQSVASIGDTLFWVGSSPQGYGQIWMAQNYQPTKISVPAIDYIIQSFSTVEDAVGYCYSQEGHFFYVISFTNGNKTFVYDLTTQQWHERSYYDISNGTTNRHLSQYSVFFDNKTIVSDYLTGTLYSLEMGYPTDGMNLIRRVRTSQHQHSDRKRLFWNDFEIDFQRGQGTATGQGEYPSAMLYISDDGGFTYTSGLAGSLGAEGQYSTRLRWSRLGNSRDRVFKLVLTDPVSTSILGARADIKVSA
jgi:hypothetical protein